MRRIINGRTYDTETAEWIASRREGNPSDFRHLSEDLHRTKKGAWFIAGEGGPMSKYRAPVESNSWMSGSALLVLTDDEARDWIEAHANHLAADYFETEEA